MKILVCCGNGLGSSFMIEMNVKKVLNELNLSGIEVNHADLASAKGIPSDLYVGTRDIASQLQGLGGEVVSLDNMISIDELRTKLQEGLKKLGKL